MIDNQAVHLLHQLGFIAFAQYLRKVEGSFILTIQFSYMNNFTYEHAKDNDSNVTIDF